MAKESLVLHQAFKYEDYQEVEAILNSFTSLNQLLQTDENGYMAWEYKEIPEAYLALVIKRWFNLVESQGKAPQIPTDFLSQVSLDIAFNKIKSPEELERKLNHYSYHRVGRFLKRVTDPLSTFLPMLSLILVASHKALDAPTLFLDSRIGQALPFLMLISAAMRIYQIKTEYREININHILEIGLIFLSLALTIASLINDSNPLMIIGAVAGIVQSLFEMITEYQLYCAAPQGTDRKIAYKQSVIEKTVSLVQNTVSLGLTLLMISGSMGMVPLMFCFAAIVATSVSWKLLSDQTRHSIKASLGFGKSSYVFFESKQTSAEEDQPSDDAQLIVPVI